MENTFFGNVFQFDRVLGVKSFPFLFYLQISFSEKQREREREREPIVSDHKPSTSPANSKLQSDDRTHQIASFSSITALRRSHHTARSRLRLISLSRDLTFNSEPSTHRSLTHQSLFLCDFDFCCCCGWCGSGVLVVVAFDCRSLLPWVELEFRWCVVLFRWWV